MERFPVHFMIEKGYRGLIKHGQRKVKAEPLTQNNDDIAYQTELIFKEHKDGLLKKEVTSRNARY